MNLIILHDEWTGSVTGREQWMLFTSTFAITLIVSSRVSVANLVAYVLDKQTTRRCRKLAGRLGSEGFDQWYIIQLLAGY